MSDIVIGDSVWQDEAGTNTEGGWNSTGSIWGSADNDVFTFDRSLYNLLSCSY